MCLRLQLLALHLGLLSVHVSGVHHPGHAADRPLSPGADRHHGQSCGEAASVGSASVSKMSNFDVRSLYCHLSLMGLTGLLGQCLYAVGGPQAAIFVQVEARAYEESGCADMISFLFPIS